MRTRTVQLPRLQVFRMRLGFRLIRLGIWASGEANQALLKQMIKRSDSTEE